MVQQDKMRWGDLDEEDGGDSDFMLPPKQVIGPDDHGLKKVIEYRFNEDGNKVKITTTTRVRKLAESRLSKSAVERRSWPKFGDAVRQDVGNRLTMVSTEEISLERPRGTKADAIVDPLIPPAGGVLKVCRTCGKKGDHWTSNCPLKEAMAPPEIFIDKPAAKPASDGGKNIYIPPSQRDGPRKTPVDMRRRNEENSVRVSNLSEDARDVDLMDLFGTFGAISRVYIAINHGTKTSKGYGFVNFVNREDGQRAINKLNGYGYDNLILHVEWAPPRVT